MIIKIGCRQFLKSVGLVFVTFTLQAQHNLFNGYAQLFTPPLSYAVYKTEDLLVIDGNASETSWRSAPWSAYFSDIEGERRPEPAYKSRFKMLWNDQMLFIYVEMEEPHIWATLKEHDQVIFHDHDIEVFIDPDGDAQNYFEIEVNALKTVFDLFLPHPYRNGGSALIPWDVHQLQVGVQVSGTMNNPSDIDKGWSIEMAIPFQGISLGNDVLVPGDGSIWRINFSRVEWDLETKDGKYHKKINPATQNPYAEHNWVWSPQGLIDMHYPERWGYALFTSAVAGSTTVVPTLPKTEGVVNYLWLAYYKQMAHRRDKSFYANNLKTLGFADPILLIDGDRYKLLLERTTDQFIISAKNVKTGEAWQINHQGIIIKKSSTMSIRP